MKKRGFTLIELLAVIVILAVIALIATPAVLNIIEDSRKSAAEASARNIINAAKTYYMQETMNGNEVDTIIDLEENLIKYDGEKATKGYVAFETNGSTSGKIYINGYCVIVSINNEVESTKVTSEECDVTNNGGHDTSIPTMYKKYNDGDYVFFNPKDNIPCESATSSATGTNDTCMKWYAFLDSEDSETVNLILDHNTTDYMQWHNYATGTTPDRITEELATDVANWNAAVKETARLITAQEINQIAPSASTHTWNVNEDTGYYLHTGTTAIHYDSAGTNTYAWLFDNTYSCVFYGCNVSDKNASGYWTSTYAFSEKAWKISNDGKFVAEKINAGGHSGVRPVITVNKSIFE